jgi:nucleoside-diphosphate-sugar epimerase
MVMLTANRRVLVTGGGTFLGDNIAAALLAEGAEVTLLLRPGAENRLGDLASHVRYRTADVWDAASLRGQARGHMCVVNTIGSLTADPSQGLSYHRLNFVSARNVVNMCVSDGVPHVVLLSSARAPWMNSQYVSAKREAEEYVRRMGMSASIIRAPLVYSRGKSRPLFFEFVTLFRPFGMRRAAPMPVDVLARGVARIAMNPKREKAIYYAPDLRRLNTREESRSGIIELPSDAPPQTQPARLLQQSDDEAPFGWTPPRK